MSNTIKLYFHNEFYSSFKGKTDSVAEEMKQPFQNKLVFFPVNWNDYSFFTLFNCVFYGDGWLEEIGGITICHEELTIDSLQHYQQVNGTNRTETFLYRDDLLGKDLDIESNPLGEQYFSYVQEDFFIKLYKLLKGMKKKDEFAFIFEALREIGFIKIDEQKIRKIKTCDWYKKSLNRYGNADKIFDFNLLILREKKGMEENSYYIIRNLPKYKQFLKDSDELYEWINRRNFSLREIQSIVDFVKKRLENENMKDVEKKILLRFKEELRGLEKDKDASKILIKIDSLLENKEFFLLIGKIRKRLEVEEGNVPTIGHYTTLSTLQELIKRDEGAFLRLTNSKQLNDPLEGRAFLDFVFGEEENKREKWDASSTYVSSATTEKDSLPMWKQYAGDTKGVMLVYDKDYLSSINRLPFVEICRVAYLDIDSKNNLVNVYVDGEKDIDLLNALNDIKKISKNEVIVDEIRKMSYYFKKRDYSYENEYRILVNKKSYNMWKRNSNKNWNKEVDVKTVYNEELEVMFLYIYLEEIKLRYQEIIFGPKSPDLDYVAPYIKHCDPKIEISRSEITYR